MNKPNFITKNLNIGRNCSKMLRSGLFAFLTLISFSQMATSQCDFTMACNDGINMSLDINCQLTLTADLILEDMHGVDADYEVLAFDSQGNPVDADPGTSGTQLDGTWINQVLITKVRHIACDLTCWGNILLQDKLEPTFPGCTGAPVDRDCDDNLAPTTEGGTVPRPIAVDACGGVLTYTYSDEETALACVDPFVKSITRTWVVTDASGNTASCDQIIRVIKGSLAAVTFPPNYDDVDEPSLECGSLTTIFLPSGAVSPETSGYPTGLSCDNIQWFYEDLIFDLCGSGIKTLRQWTVLDWCTGSQLNHNQIIKIIDNKPPVVSCVDDNLVGYTNPGECVGDFLAPAPFSIFDCSETDYIVGYKLRDESGNPFLNPIYTGITGNSTIGFTIPDLPQDTTWLVYTITDECGYSSQCFTEVFIQDNEAPTPACEGFTIVSLEPSGWGEVYAETFDDHSWDNCGVDSFAVRRVTSNCGNPSDLVFGDKITFCCEDVGAGYIDVVLRVFDAAGNYNDCYVNVDVQDKFDPTITCPGNVTISCTQDADNLSITGSPTSSDNCSSTTVTYTDSGSFNDCGVGTIYRTWTATDDQGRTATCIQTINVTNNDVLSYGDVSWPGDRTVSGCDLSGTSPEELNSIPVINNNGCIVDATSYDDEVFYNSGTACVTILRHWKVADWCTFDPSNPVFLEYTQEIDVINNQNPTFTSDCSNMQFDADDGTCEAYVDLLAFATDDCTSTADLIYSFDIDDLSTSAPVDFTGTGNHATGTFSSGTYKITFYAQDECGNIGICMYNFFVSDGKAPTPICRASVTWVLDADGNAEIWASDFNIKSEDTCTPEDQLIFSFNEAGNQQVLFFDCSDIPNGIAEEIMLNMYVIDSDGNSDFCTVTLVLQDNNSNACADQAGAMASISGRVVSHELEGLENIGVELMDLGSSTGTMNMTDSEGDYGFNGVPFYNDYEVGPYKNDDPLNGVSTLDLVLIQKHILNLIQLDDSYKLIAADINNSQSISSIDLIELRKLILGVYVNYPDNTSWRFVRRDHEFELWDEPWGFPENFEYDDLVLSDEDVDFVAVKIGDVNYTATNNLLNNQAENRSSEEVSLSIDEQTFVANEKVLMDVKAADLINTIGMQFTMSFDESQMTPTNIIAGALNVNAQNFGFDDAGNGLISFSWNAVEELEILKEETLFTIEWTSAQKGDFTDLQINDAIATAESYDAELTTYNVVLRDGTTEVLESQDFVLLQNTPNPFVKSTDIQFQLPENMNASISVFDLSGKLLTRVSGEFKTGLNTVSFDNTQINQSGVLYYKLEAGSFTATRKMIVLK